jgi:hypothetical protein
MNWLNGKLTYVTPQEAVTKLIEAKGFLERYGNPHDKWTDAINIGIEAIQLSQRIVEAKEQIAQERDKSYASEAHGHGWGMQSALEILERAME